MLVVTCKWDQVYERTSGNELTIDDCYTLENENTLLNSSSSQGEVEGGGACVLEL